MPKIPVYEQQVKMAAGSLGPRASAAFEAPGRALAGLGQQVSDTAFKFGMIERDREDKRIAREEYATAFQSANDALFADTSTNVTDAQINFEATRKKILDDIDGRGYSKRRTEVAKASVEKLLLQKQFDAKLKASNRGKTQSAAASDKAVVIGLDELKSLNPNSPLFQPKVDALRGLVDDDVKSGLPTKFNPGSLEAQILSIVEDGNRSGIQDQIAGAASEQQVNAALQSQEFKGLGSASQNTLRSLAKSKVSELNSALVATFANAIPIENVGNTTFDTVEDVEEKIENARQGKFDDPNLEAQWKILGDEEKIKIEAAWQARKAAAQAQFDFKRKARDRAEEDANENLYTDGKKMVMSGSETAIENIRGMEFVGAKGEVYREQLIDLAGRRARGEILNDSKPTAHREAQQKIFTGEVTDVTQGFQLTTDTDEMRSLPEYQENGGLSLLQRQGTDFSDNDVEAFERYIRAEARITESDANSTFVRNMKAFDDFTKNYKDKIIGNPNFASLSLNSDSRYYDFTKQMEARYLDAIERGDSPRELLDPRSPKFLIRPNENFTPTNAELMQEITDSLVDTGALPSLQELAPPPIPTGMSYADYLQTDVYKTYRTGPNYPRYIEMMRRQQQQ